MELTDREKDVQKLCEEVKSMSTDFYDNPNGGYEYRCPFCYKMKYGGGFGSDGVQMSEIEHKSTCAYLIAKDLSTNVKI